VLAFILPTPGRGVVKVTKDHKKISWLMGPYNTETGNHYIYTHGFEGGHPKDPKGKEGVVNVVISSARWLRGSRPAWPKNEEIFLKKFPTF
jgi:hypothetical protein